MDPKVKSAVTAVRLSRWLGGSLTVIACVFLALFGHYFTWHDDLGLPVYIGLGLPMPVVIVLVAAIYLALCWRLIVAHRKVNDLLFRDCRPELWQQAAMMTTNGIGLRRRELNVAAAGYYYMGQYVTARGYAGQLAADSKPAARAVGWQIFGTASIALQDAAGAQEACRQLAMLQASAKGRFAETLALYLDGLNAELAALQGDVASARRFYDSSRRRMAAMPARPSNLATLVELYDRGEMAALEGDEAAAVAAFSQALPLAGTTCYRARMEAYLAAHPQA